MPPEGDRPDRPGRTGVAQPGADGRVGAAAQGRGAGRAGGRGLLSRHRRFPARPGAADRTRPGDVGRAGVGGACRTAGNEKGAKTGKGRGLAQDRAVRAGAAPRADRPPRSAGLGACPICREGEVTENARAYGCSRYREGCGFTIWKTVAGLTLTEDQVRRLIAQGGSRASRASPRRRASPSAPGCGWMRPGRSCSISRPRATDTGGGGDRRQPGRGLARPLDPTEARPRRPRSGEGQPRADPLDSRPTPRLPQMRPRQDHRRPARLRLQPLPRGLRLRGLEDLRRPGSRGGRHP
jgi:hypothetical protein